MHKIALGFGIMSLALSGCSKSAQTSQLAAFDVEEPAPAPNPGMSPQIAYAFSLSYRIPEADIGKVQQQQTALCTRLGTAKCQVAASSVVDTGSASASGSARLFIDARLAQSFIRRLDAVAGNAGGAVASRETTAEDVTKQVVDNDARLRAKQALANRLMRLIESANGKVGDLVAAEKAFADVQEELDAARSTQAVLRQRVAMSDIRISYVATETTGIAAPVTASLRDAGATLGTSIATLVTFLFSAAPWLAVLAFAIWLIRRASWRPRLRWYRASSAGRGGGETITTR